MFKSVLGTTLTKGVSCVVLLLLTAYGCAASDDINQEDKKFLTTTSQMQELRKVVIEGLCKEGMYAKKDEAKEECMTRIKSMVLECENKGYVKAPKKFDDDGNEFSQYAKDMIDCVSER